MHTDRRPNLPRRQCTETGRDPTYQGGSTLRQEEAQLTKEAMHLDRKRPNLPRSQCTQTGDPTYQGDSAHRQEEAQLTKEAVH